MEKFPEIENSPPYNQSYNNFSPPPPPAPNAHKTFTGPRRSTRCPGRPPRPRRSSGRRCTPPPAAGPAPPPPRSRLEIQLRRCFMSAGVSLKLGETLETAEKSQKLPETREIAEKSQKLQKLQKLQKPESISQVVLKVVIVLLSFGLGADNRRESLDQAPGLDEKTNFHYTALANFAFIPFCKLRERRMWGAMHPICLQGSDCTCVP